ncbi:MAG: glycosyltransferase [Bacteroidota bacterium]
MKKILVLYTELADYIYNSFAYFADNYNAEFHIIHWPINSEAPFAFSKNESIRLYSKESFNNKSLTEFTLNLTPDAVICAGWMDKDYIRISKNYAKKIPTILTMDNHWEGSIKQYILRIVGSVYLKGVFSNIWVPGSPQKHYAEKIGFSKEQILTGFYVANFNIFKEVNYVPEKSFIYVGRYIEHKGIKDLWTAFVQLKKEYPNDWKLKCIGTGDLWDERVIDEDIEHFGFLQPGDIAKEIKGGVFVLPSHFEPWGVVVHEFATAGFPMILSNKVGAGTEFLDENGYLFEGGNIYDLKEKMKKFMLPDGDNMKKMSLQSEKLSKNISNEYWSEQLNKVLSKKGN